MDAGEGDAPIGLGFRAMTGGSVVVGVALDGATPRLALSSFVATADAGDRLAREPYHVAAAMARGPHGGASEAAKAAVAEGRARQAALAAAGLDAIVRGLRQNGSKRGVGQDATEQAAGRTARPVVAALLVNRAGWVADLLDYSLAFADHPPVAEGLAVLDARRAAFAHIGIEAIELDEKGLPAQAAAQLGRDRDEIDLVVRTIGAAAGRPWRREQKMACLAGWVAVAALR